MSFNNSMRRAFLVSNGTRATFQHASFRNLSSLHTPPPAASKQHDHDLINLSLIGKPGSGKGTYGALLAESLQCPLIVIGDVLRTHVQRNTAIGMEIAEFQREGRLADDALVAKALLSHLETIFDQHEDHPSKSSRRDGNTKFGFILDGFPRTLSQAELMFHSEDDPLSAEASSGTIINTSLLIPWPEKFRISFAVNIDVPDEICLDKMLGRRKCSKCNGSFNVSDVNTLDGFVMPPQLPSPYPCDKCDMDSDWEKRLDDTEEVMTRRIAEFHEKSAPVSQFFQARNQLATFVPFNGVSDFHLMEEMVRQKAKTTGMIPVLV